MMKWQHFGSHHILWGSFSCWKAPQDKKTFVLFSQGKPSSHTTQYSAINASIRTSTTKKSVLICTGGTGSGRGSAFGVCCCHQTYPQLGQFSLSIVPSPACSTLLCHVYHLFCHVYHMWQVSKLPAGKQAALLQNT